MIPARPFKKLRLVNQSDLAFTAPVTEIDLHKQFGGNNFGDAGTAAGRSVISLTEAGGNGKTPQLLELWPYCLGADNDVATFRVIGWRRLLPVGSSEPRTLFVPGILCDAVCTFSTFVGRAGFPVLDTERFADTIAITSVLQPTSLSSTTLLDGYIKAFTMANNTPARIQIPLEGFEAFEVQIDNTTGTGTGNALYTLIDQWE